jgi:hypothetical protein
VARWRLSENNRGVLRFALEFECIVEFQHQLSFMILRLRL